MQAGLGVDRELAVAYRRAHEAYLDFRSGLGEVPEIEGISAGRYARRVKLPHALAAHSLAAGPRVNPLGDEVLDLSRAAGGFGPAFLTLGRGAQYFEMARPSPPQSESPRARPVAAIDCGTNTIKLLIGDLPRVVPSRGSGWSGSGRMFSIRTGRRAEDQALGRPRCDR